MSEIVSLCAPHDFMIVGVGASAGGVDAFSQLLRLLPQGSNLSFVLFQHLDPIHPSGLCEALARATAMPVQAAAQGMRVERGHVYVITPNTELTLHEGVLVLSPRSSDLNVRHQPIDTFLRSLAADRGPRAVGVLLSGLASDATDGVRAIRAAAGIAFVQAPSSARFSSRPESASGAGVVDSSLSIPELAAELLRLSQHLYLRIVDEQNTNAERESAKEELHSVDDDFLATLSHELRTPLASMLLNAQRLREGAVLDQADLKRAGDAIERAVNLQTKLIDDLLDVSRMAAGKLSLESSAVDLCELVRATRESLRPGTEAKQLQVEESYARGLEPIWADPKRTQQVIANLLSNAIKFTPRFGQITLSVDAAEGGARVRIVDTGIGISADFLPRVFSHFAQSDRSITRRYGGLGLGLSLARHLVELQGGAMHAESPGVDRGATFTVTFPFARATDAAASEPARTSALRFLERSGKMKHYEALVDVRVLFIDDDFRTREAVLEVLELTGARVALAASAADGLMALDTFEPQVIVCDIAMPGEDGYAFIRKLRTREGGRVAPIPVLALTALASVDDKRRALAAGFQLHLAKPVDIDRLRDSVLDLVKLSVQAPRLRV